MDHLTDILKGFASGLASGVAVAFLVWLFRKKIFSSLVDTRDSSCVRERERLNKKRKLSCRERLRLANLEQYLERVGLLNAIRTMHGLDYCESQEYRRIKKILAEEKR